MILDHINDIAAICAGHGVKTAIISPGSRSAPLTLAFARHPDIETRVISDERSAAFIAMGMAQQKNRPVVLICTSGSAAYNYAPAVAEAYFQEVPLLILTADRPPEWINQYDGQTIQQTDIYGKHVKASFSFPDNPNHPDILWHGNRMVNEALIQSTNEPPGPVHINVPLREPFYPETEERTFFRKVRLIEKADDQLGLTEAAWQELAAAWAESSKRLVIAGQSSKNDTLTESVNQFCTATAVPVLSDVISNLHEANHAVIHQDAFLHVQQDELNADLAPDLLITFGKSNISKNLKRFIRKHKPTHHWHIQPHDRYQDTFQSLTRLVRMEPEEFFAQFMGKVEGLTTASTYLNSWKKKDAETRGKTTDFLSQQPFGEFLAVSGILSTLPVNSHLHLSNSMAVRYANLLGVKGKGQLSIWCNRGTSGIDGSNSTAVGAALSQGQMVTLVTGDMAFFYDRNAFWHNYKLPNLRMIVLNNHAGGIFRLIKGPSDQPELKEYFETEQQLEGQNLAADFDIEYRKVSTQDALADALSSFYSPSNHAKIIEVITDSTLNAEIYKAYWSFILT